MMTTNIGAERAWKEGLFTMMDGKRECPSCALPIDADADVCPYCGYDLPRQKNSLRFAAILMALLLIWPLIKLVQYLFG